MPISLKEQEINELVQATSNWSGNSILKQAYMHVNWTCFVGAQLDNLFREAAMVSLRENVNNTKVRKIP